MALPINTTSSPSIPSTSLVSLGPDLIGSALAFFADIDTQSFSTTSKELSKLSIQKTAVNHRKEIVEFIKTLLGKELSQEQKDSLFKVQTSVEVEFLNLPLVKKHRLLIKEKIIEVLVTVDSEKLHAFQSLSTPAFFKNIFLIAHTQKEIALANALQDTFIRSVRLKDLIFDLLTAGEITKATALANSITVDYLQAAAFSEICSFLADYGKCTQALEIIHSIQNASQKFNALMRFAYTVAKAGNSETAIEIINSLTAEQKALDVSCERRIEVSNWISLALTKVENTKALELVATISEEWIRDRILKELSLYQANHGNLEVALQIAKSILSPIIRTEPLYRIALGYAQLGNSSKAIEIAHLDEIRCDYILQRIAK